MLARLDTEHQTVDILMVHEATPSKLSGSESMELIEEQNPLLQYDQGTTLDSWSHQKITDALLAASIELWSTRDKLYCPQPNVLYQIVIWQCILCFQELLQEMGFRISKYPVLG